MSLNLLLLGKLTSKRAAEKQDKPSDKIKVQTKVRKGKQAKVTNQETKDLPAENEETENEESGL